MPPAMILDPDMLDCSKVVMTREEIYKILPQQHEFSQLDGVIHIDPSGKVAAAYRDVRADEWWCRGHMPGHPIFPGVLMVECGAQLAAIVQSRVMPFDEGFLGFAGIDDVKFRGAVIPPTRIIMIGRLVEARRRRFICDLQGYCNGEMVFEGQITGMQIKP
jgi:3-hydroxyacyl-[acyl-carrier-protein] dehydratase